MIRLRSLLWLALLVPAAVGAEQDGSAVAGAVQVGAAQRGEVAVDVSVLYATNRKRQDDGVASVSYNGERGEPGYGRCEVAFSPIPLVSQVARKVPFYVPRETNEVRLAEQADPQAFWESLNAELAKSPGSSVVVFVHGYNYGFERTCRMAAELQRDLRGRASVLMFSWPANGLPTDYVRDQADVEWSVPFLARFLAELGYRIGRDRVQVLAHSLGSRGVFFALQRLRADTDQPPLIRRLVLLAPDFDSQTFVELLPVLGPLTGGITLYASSNDAPLKVSRQLSGYPRLGEGGEHLTVAEGMETIDVSGAGRYQIFGHEYFFYHPLVAADLVTLLTTGKSAAGRPGLRQATRDGSPYWEILGPSGR